MILFVFVLISKLLLIKSPAKSVSIILIHHNELLESVCWMWDEEKMGIHCVCVCFSNVYLNGQHLEIYADVKLIYRTWICHYCHNLWMKRMTFLDILWCFFFNALHSWYIIWGLILLSCDFISHIYNCHAFLIVWTLLNTIWTIIRPCKPDLSGHLE